jgi:hypothetical protein
VSPAPPASGAGSSAAGSPSDALAAFASTALADAKLAARGDPDWRVSEAFALGWQMSEIYRPDAPEQAPPVQAGDLPDLSQLSSADWDEIGLYQLQAGISKLSEAIIVAGLTVPDAEQFSAELQPLTGEDRADALKRFHINLLATLTAADFRLGKAYGLGRAIADATRFPANYHVELQSSRVSVLAAWIRDLASALPPHASRAVARSIEQWGVWAANTPQSGEGTEAKILPHLQPQGRLWRSLLSGEKRPVDTLQQIDYLTAGEESLKNAGALARRFLRHYLWACLGALALLIAGIVVILVAGNPAGIVSGAVAILAGLGFGWKTIGTSLGTAAARVESPLWGAALDDVVYRRITPSPLIEPSSHK